MDDEKLFITDRPLDVIHAVLSGVQSAAAEGKPMNDAVLLEIEEKVRFEFGGWPNYCGKKTPREILKELVRNDHAQGISRRAIAQAYSISKRTVDRYLESI